jgi:hypothetical protein
VGIKLVALSTFKQTIIYLILMNIKNYKLPVKCFLFAVFFSCAVLAQDKSWSSDVYEVGKTYPGQITKRSGESVVGFIEAQERGFEGMEDQNNQTRVIFFSDPNDKKTKVIYKPEELKGYKIADKEYMSINYSGGFMAEPLRFLLKRTEGQIAIYEWSSFDELKPTETGPKSGKKEWKSTAVFQKGNEKPISIDKFVLRFAKKFSEYIKDNTDLSAKVANKEKGYRVVNVYSIIDEYNKSYSTK